VSARRGPPPAQMAVASAELPAFADILIAAPGSGAGHDDGEADRDCGEWQFIPAHQCLLAAASDYCSALLASRWRSSAEAAGRSSAEAADEPAAQGTDPLPADHVRLPTVQLPFGTPSTVGGLVNFVYSGQLCFRHWQGYQDKGGRPSGSCERMEARAETPPKPPSMCAECRMALLTAKLAEACLVRGLHEAVEAFLSPRLGLLRPACCYQLLKNAIDLQLWELASLISETVAPHYGQLRTDGQLDGIDPAVDEALRRAYALSKQSLAPRVEDDIKVGC